MSLITSNPAENVASACYSFNLNYSNKPAPGIQLYWPQDGAQIGSGSFTWRGAVDDPTASLWATVADGDGDTNVVAGLVERDGNFWVENIPLFAGTNYLTLTATDINGATTSNSIAVVQSNEIAIDTIWGDLNQAAAVVVGTISSSDYALWVNGVLVTNFGAFGPNTWDVENVPVNGAGRAVIQARAIPLTAQDNYGNGNNDGGGRTNSSLANPGNPTATDCVDAEMSQDKQPVIECAYFHYSYSEALQILSWSNASVVTGTILSFESVDWTAGIGGSAQYSYCDSYTDTFGNLHYEPSTFDQWQWDTNGNGFYQSYSGTNGCGDVTTTNATGYYNGPVNFPGLQGTNLTATHPVNTALTYGVGITNSFGLFSQEAASGFCLPTTGGLSLPGAYSIHAIAASAVGIVSPTCNRLYQDNWPASVIINSPPYGIITSTTTVTNQISVNNAPEDANGIAWVALPDGVPIRVSAQIPAAAMSSTTMTDNGKNPLTQILFHGTNIAGQNVAVIVGEQINLTASPGFSSYQWTVPGPAITNFYVSQDPWHTNGNPQPLTQTNNESVSFFWAGAGTNSSPTNYTVTCSATSQGVALTNTTTFSVVRPVVHMRTKLGSPIITNFIDIVQTNNIFVVLTNFYLSFGTSHGTNLAAGIYFINDDLALPTNYYYNGGNTEYAVEWVQVITNAAWTVTISNGVSDVVPHLKQAVGAVLDSTYPYGYAGFPFTEDSPGIPLSLSNLIYATLTQYSQMTYIFTPANGNPVPLWVDTWLCSGSATGFGTNITNWSPGVPTFITNLSSLDSGANYPLWTNNIKNTNIFKWNPPLHRH